MIDYNVLKKEVEYYETVAQSYDDLARLATYYTILDKYSAETAHRPVQHDEEELDDILPALRKYNSAKKQYALNMITQEGVNVELQKLVVEINEFLQVLYSNTTCPAEREILKGIKGG